MKIITLIPVKNEFDILQITIPIISSYSDIIIIADQFSIDGSRQFYQQFPKIRVIDNNQEGHYSSVRWALLDEARRIEGEKFILYIDADEFIPPLMFKNFMEQTKIETGCIYSFSWTQLWKTTKYYNYSRTWRDHFKPIAFLDDGTLDYNSTQSIISDHTARVPSFFSDGHPAKIVQVKNIPLIHLAWLSWDKMQMKQAWYRCAEFIISKNANRINYIYSITLDSNKTQLESVPFEWLKDLMIPEEIMTFQSKWHQNQIFEWFDKYGIQFFEPLQIWHIPKLRQAFEARMGRIPVDFKYAFLFRLKNIIKPFIPKIIISFFIRAFNLNRDRK